MHYIEFSGKRNIEGSEISLQFIQGLNLKDYPEYKHNGGRKNIPLDNAFHAAAIAMGSGLSPEILLEVPLLFEIADNPDIETVLRLRLSSIEGSINAELLPASNIDDDENTRGDVFKDISNTMHHNLDSLRQSLAGGEVATSPLDLVYTYNTDGNYYLESVVLDSLRQKPYDVHMYADNFDLPRDSAEAINIAGAAAMDVELREAYKSLEIEGLLGETIWEKLLYGSKNGESRPTVKHQMFALFNTLIPDGDTGSKMVTVSLCATSHIEEPVLSIEIDNLEDLREELMAIISDKKRNQDRIDSFVNEFAHAYEVALPAASYNFTESVRLFASQLIADVEATTLDDTDGSFLGALKCANLIRAVLDISYGPFSRPDLLTAWGYSSYEALYKDMISWHNKAIAYFNHFMQKN